MPVPYDPDAAVLYDGSGEIDPGTFALQEEEFLLVHRCRRKATVGETKREIGQLVTRSGGTFYSVDPTPRCLFRSDIDQQLEFSIEATALSLAGLANFHPGLGLDGYALAFLNGSAAELPFGFTGGEWIYMDPEQDCAAGDMAEVSFRVVREFAELRADWVPDTGTEEYVLIPQQAALEITSSTLLNALLRDAFNNVDAFSTSPFTVSLYAGNPASGGTLATDVFTPPAGWVARRPGDVHWKDVLDSDEITWAAAATAATITHIRFSRNGYHTDLALAEPLAVPAGATVRAPAGVFPLILPWPMDDDPGLLSDTGSWMLMYYCGGDRATFLPEDRVIGVMAFAAAPSGGAGPLASFTAAPTTTYFTVSGTTVTFNAIDDVATNATGSDWEITYVQVASSNPNLIWLTEAYTVTVPSAGTLSFDGSPILDLASPP